MYKEIEKEWKKERHPETLAIFDGGCQINEWTFLLALKKTKYQKNLMYVRYHLTGTQ